MIIEGIEINRAIIIKSPWIDYILQGLKCLEVRGSNTHVRGWVGVIKSGSGFVYGAVNINDSVKLNEKNFNSLKSSHMLYKKDIDYNKLLDIYNNPWGWSIADHKKFKTPVPYTHKKGCVIWCKI